MGRRAAVCFGLGVACRAAQCFGLGLTKTGQQSLHRTLMSVSQLLREDAGYCSADSDVENDSTGQVGHDERTEQRSRTFLKIALATNTVLIVVQLTFTVLTGSLLLFSDTIDGLIDSFSLVIPLMSVAVAKKCRSDHGPTICDLEK